ncbi:ABC transporter permease [Thermobispora bispora]|jgi:spermidine/putrescine transport system permease protein|uniref:Binding-protein-dependent transport systems inner membrane component n=1 Tax=Thermobispora bispora (strain ATCC 19993 / DSM 43833 / CBS 139.67 / JCM 10125 / KCTC 9307 / NBRC 14880 / R51) TaxID=469371 RepID=D6Y7R6_THEBD|nr:ABC transporter permease [Thermobispora bispora]ADG87735.1 binding-protein-dependent transport systems inner membrane component [Thermobispora bispora DSM 43833]MBO2473072.1 ABC transporter permease [Actinomycetales bacterium]MBX6167702.1 ABC transporter permease [Thermobispora bispora]
MTKVRRLLSGRLLQIWTWLVIAWLLLPIAVMILFGFNDTKGRYNTAWQGFTLKWYGKLFEIEDLTRALVNSLLLALLTMVIAGVLGSMLGLALGRYRFRGSGALNVVMFAAISCAEIVMGASLLSLFVTLAVPLGFWTILISHVMFSISYVAVTVRARVMTLDRSLEDAARDLGAGTWDTFRLVTLPLIFPGVLAGSLLAFALSIDDFVITNFNAGGTVTFPLWIWGATRVGIPPQVNVMGTLIFAAGVLIALGNLLLTRRR